MPRWTVTAAFVSGVFRAALAAPGDRTADAVLGQPGMTQNTPNQPAGLPTAANLSPSNASDVAVAPDGRLYVSDADNNRVLSWPSAASYASGQAADMVFGQPGFTSNAPNNGGVSGAGLNLPQGLWVDAAGNLWVTDAFNHRVLKFNNPAADATPTTADLVIGQHNLNENLENLGLGGTGPDVALPDSLQFPGRVIAIGADVWVADSGNSRVLHYTNVTANKPLADRVFGQYGNFFKRAKNNDGHGQNGFFASADNLLNPIGLAVDAAGSLYIADWGNHRVLRYDDPIAGDTTADAVLGQPDFVSNAVDNGGPTAGLHLPIDLAIDPFGRLLAADSGNNRVLVFSLPRMNPFADDVFGQLGNLAAEDPNHGLGPSDLDADGLFGPTGVAIDAAGNVHVVDTNNQRALRFDAPLPVPTGDMNCDGIVSADDAAALALALIDPTAFAVAYPGCGIARSDVNGDLRRDGRDVQALVVLLVGS